MTKRVSPPGDGGLAARLDTLQRRITETGRSSPLSVTTCVVRLASDVAVTGDVRPVTEWEATPEVDTTADPDTPAGEMYFYAQGSPADTWWQMPCDGRFSVRVHSRWATAATYTGANPPLVAASLLCNTTDASQAIADNTTINTNAGTTSLTTVCEDQRFAADDQIRVNFWSSQAATLLAQSLNATTHVVIRYLGPN